MRRVGVSAMDEQSLEAQSESLFCSFRLFPCSRQAYRTIAQLATTARSFRCVDDCCKRLCPCSVLCIVSMQRTDKLSEWISDAVVKRRALLNELRDKDLKRFKYLIEQLEIVYDMSVVEPEIAYKVPWRNDWAHLKTTPTLFRFLYRFLSSSRAACTRRKSANWHCCVLKSRRAKKWSWMVSRNDCKRLRGRRKKRRRFVLGSWKVLYHVVLKKFEAATCKVVGEPLQIAGVYTTNAAENQFELKRTRHLYLNIDKRMEYNARKDNLTADA